MGYLYLFYHRQGHWQGHISFRRRLGDSDWYVSGHDTAVSVRGVGMGQRQVDETVLSVEPVERR